MILIDAAYIHESGGKALLEYLIYSLKERNKPFYLLLDNRLSGSFIEDLGKEQYRVIASSETNRAIFYRGLDKTVNTIFCFANVPPPIPVKHIPVYIYFQNRLILSDLFERNMYPIKQKILLLLRRIYIRWKTAKGYNWIVQTPVMKSQLSSSIKIPLHKITVLPFFKEYRQPSSYSHNENNLPAQFLYVADGVVQKNHLRLLAAWEYLFDTCKIKLELHLTVPERFAELNSYINELCSKGVAVVNHGRIERNELNVLYRRCRFLVFPSLAESFGLPLIEAVQAGCDVLASNLPYVNEVIKPSDIFDPYDPVAIAESVIRNIKNNAIKPSELAVDDHIYELIRLLFTPV